MYSKLRLTSCLYVQLWYVSLLPSQAGMLQSLFCYTCVYLHVSPAYRLALFIVLSRRKPIIVGATTSDTRCILIRANVQQIVVTGCSQFVCVFSCACVCICVCAAGSAPLCHAPRVCPCWLAIQTPTPLTRPLCSYSHLCGNLAAYVILFRFDI